MKKVNPKILRVFRIGAVGLMLFCMAVISYGQNRKKDRSRVNHVDRITWIVDGQRTDIPGQLKNWLRSDSLGNSRSALKARILEYYYARGHMAARIDSLRFFSEDQERDYVAIQRGCKFSISSIQFKGTPPEEAVSKETYLQEGTPYSKIWVEREIERIITYYEEQGYPLVRVNVQDIERKAETCGVNIQMRIEVGRQMRVDGLLFPSLDNVDQAYIRTASGVSDSVLITPELLRSTRERLQSTGFFSYVGQPEIVVRNERHFLQIPLEERNPNLFDLVIGYVPNTREGGTVVGDGQIRIRNIFWPGSTTYLEFERQRQLVSKLNFGFRRNWIMGIPFGAGIDFRFLQQDTSYQVRDFSLTGSYSMNANLSLSGKLRRKVAVGNGSLGNTGNVLDAESIYGGLGIEYQQLDDRINPTRGIELSADLQTGVKTVTDERASSDSISNRVSQRVFEFDIQPYVPTFRRQVLTVTVHGFLLDADQMTMSDLTRFGGARSLRGYREDQFRASRLIWGDVEYRYLLDPATYGFVFGAVGNYHRPRLVTESTVEQETTGWLYAWGLGFSYNTRIGRLKFSYAVSPEDALNNGKVHFGIVADL